MQHRGGPVPSLRRRADFKRLSKGLMVRSADFLLQAEMAAGLPGRFGLTITRKVGTATERNRIRRRLKAAIANLGNGEPPLNVVIIARRSCLQRPFAELQASIARECDRSRRKLHQAPPQA